MRSEQGTHHDHWISLPGSWKGYQLDDQELKSTGYATFRLVIHLSEHDRNERLALKLPTIFHSYKLWVNGELLEEVGIVGADEQSVTPQLATRLVFFQPETDAVELVLQVANFHHHRGGITKYIELGGSDMLSTRTTVKIASEMFITTSLLVIGIYHLFLFLLRRKDRAPLYFGLFTTAFGVRSLLVGEHLITQVWPDLSWELQFKVEYLSLCSSIYFILKFADCLFPNYTSRKLHMATVTISGTLCAIILVTPAIIYTSMLPVIGVVMVLHLMYLMIGLIRATLRRVEGTFIFLLVSVVALVTVINDFLYFTEKSPIGNTSPLGLLIFTIAQIVLISLRFTRATTNEERIARELQEANDKLTEMNVNLERKVQERTQELSAAHEELRASFERLLMSEQGRKKLLANITHDLRLPLASMLGYVEAVQDGVRPERKGQYLNYIRDNTIRVNRMIEELSYLSHLETGQISFQMKPVHVTYFLRNFFSQYELVVRDSGLNFILDMEKWDDQPVHSPVVEIDAQRLDQAMFNIVSNAMKFTPSGGDVRLALSVQEVNNVESAIISIQDNGIGIPQDQLDQIFERNYRYEQSGLEKGVAGSGLGLAICREIVQAHGGAVRAESDGMTGSVFYVSLPLYSTERKESA